MKFKYILLLMMLFVGLNTNAASWQGHWTSSFGKINFIEKDIKIHNAILVFANYGKTGSIVGVSIAGELHGMFYDSKLKKGGTVLFTQNDTKKSFSGEWIYENNSKKLVWNGSKIDDERPDDLHGIDRFRSMEGQWKSNFGLLDMTQDGAFVEAKYSDKGDIYAVYSKASNLAYGIFTNKENYGILEFNLNADKQSFDGKWAWKTKSWEKQKWQGTKVK